ncbi:MAG: hypothetical protein OXC62_06315 [Aestuariivita sp.]|nr:hypothetical protein [Aestuariivita sp.]
MADTAFDTHREFRRLRDAGFEDTLDKKIDAKIDTHQILLRSEIKAVFRRHTSFVLTGLLAYVISMFTLVFTLLG